MVIYRSTYTSIPIPNTDIFSFIFSTNEFHQIKDANKPLFIDGVTDQSFSWNEVREQSALLAAGWTKRGGLKQGDMVAVFAPNQIDHAILYFSLLGAKCTISPGNPAYTEAEFEHQIRNSQASALVTIPALLPVLLKITDKIGLPRSKVFLFGDKQVEGCRPFNSLKGTETVQHPLQGIDGYNDTAFLCYSSGTTGLAKGVMLTHKNFIAQVLQTIYTEGVEHHPVDEVLLGFLPFYHIYGFTSLLLNAYFKIAPVVIMPRYDLELLCQLVEKYRITTANIVPPVAVQLAKSPIAAKYDLSSITLMGCGGAPLSKEHITELYKRIPTKILQGYGMTETTSGVIVQNKLKDCASGSIGFLSPNIECKIVNEKGQELGDDQEGEFLFRGPSIMKGYYNNAKANEETFTSDGWMRTGDVGKYCSKDESFFILDRIKELIKYKGYQVAPAELEAVLTGLEIVADCCVVGLYDDSQATEIPRAYVVLQPNVESSAKTSKIIMDHVAANLTSYKKLRGGIKFVKVIPKSPSGKILRREVKEWVKEEQKKIAVRSRL